MNDEKELLERIRGLATAGKYRVRLHALRHMIEEGFSEKNIVEALQVRSKIVENYPDEARCLVLGYFTMTEKVRSPLHVVCDFSEDDFLDFVTAYIPQKPWWVAPDRRGSTK